MEFFGVAVRLPYGEDKMPRVKAYRQMPLSGGEIILNCATLTGKAIIRIAGGGDSATVTVEEASDAGAEGQFLEVYTQNTEGGPLELGLVTGGTVLRVGPCDSYTGVLWPLNEPSDKFFDERNISHHRLGGLLSISGLRPTTIVGPGTQDDALL